MQRGAERLHKNVCRLCRGPPFCVIHICYPWRVLGTHKSAWFLLLLSAGLQIVIFPLPDFYFLSWVAVAPLLLALLRARQPDTLQLTEGTKLLPARPWQGFMLGYLCGIVWYAGTCYWVYSTMRQYGGINAIAALGILLLFSLYLGLYHGAFGLIVSLLARDSLRALLLAPAVWVAVELARTRISGFPWDLLGITQVDNVPLSRIATVTGVYGVSFEIMLVNVAVATGFLVKREKQKPLLLAAGLAIVVLQAGRWISPPAVPAERQAVLVQANVPILDGTDWTRSYFEETLRDLMSVSVAQPGSGQRSPDLIVWPESPAPFYVNDPFFRNTLGGLAGQTHAWVVAGSIGTQNAGQSADQSTGIYNSAVLMDPQGNVTARYDKVHLVPFGEYVPFQKLFAFAGGLTKQVGEFTSGTSRLPLETGDSKLGVFICYESIFPDEVRRFATNGAQVLINVSNDGWYGDSGAYSQHLKQARMRAIENSRWLLRDTNTGVTASIDPYGRIVAQVQRKVRTGLVAPYGLSTGTTFYTRHGDWFAYLCAIISAGAVFISLLRAQGRAKI